jgi:hypothetical protein
VSAPGFCSGKPAVVWLIRLTRVGALWRDLLLWAPVFEAPLMTEGGGRETAAREGVEPPYP